MKSRFLTMSIEELDDYLKSLSTITAKACAYTTISRLRSDFITQKKGRKK